MLITTHQDNVWTIKLQMKYIQNSKPLHFKRESTPASEGRIKDVAYISKHHASNSFSPLGRRLG